MLGYVGREIFPTPTVIESLKGAYGALPWFNIAMEHSQFINDLPIEYGDFPWLC